MSEDRPSQLRDELRRRRLQRASELQEATPLMLVGRYPTPVAVTETTPPAIELEVVPRTPPPRTAGPSVLMIALMLVPAAVALISTSLLLYLLLLEKRLGLFVARDAETVQAAEENEKKDSPSRFKVAPRYGFASARPAATAPEPKPAAEASAPRDSGLDAIAQQRAVQLQFGQVTPAPERRQSGQPVAVAPLQETATVTVAPAAPPVGQAPTQPPIARAPAAAPAAPASQVPLQETATVTVAPAPPVGQAPTQPPIAQAPAAAPAAPASQVPPQALAQWSDPSRQPAQTGAPTVPSDDVLLLLIRSSLYALHQSNTTGNYNLLRSITSIEFHNANPPQSLLQAFANFRARSIDLSPVMVLQPKLIAKPQINERGILRLKGFFPTEPQRIYFDLKFMRGPQGRWRLFGIAADVAAPKPAAGQAGSGQSGAAQPSAQQSAMQSPPPQLAPAETASAEPAAPAPPAAEAAPPLPIRKPSALALSSSAGQDGESTNESAAATVEDVRGRVDEADSEPPEKKRFWPFRR